MDWNNTIIKTYMVALIFGVGFAAGVSFATYTLLFW